jgi:hypothetical protein
MTKMKPVGWFDRDRNSRLANVMFPYLSDPATQKEMLTTSEVEGKRAGLERRIKEGQEEYKPTAPKVTNSWLNNRRVK